MEQGSGDEWKEDLGCVGPGSVGQGDAGRGGDDGVKRVNGFVGVPKMQGQVACQNLCEWEMFEGYLL